MGSPGIFIASLLLAVVSGEIHFKRGSPHVKLENGGEISGAVKFSRDGRPYNEFVGIPYTTVPGRFQEPQALTKPSWTGVLNATTAGPVCLQAVLGATEKPMGGEDCLTINVHVPMTTTGFEKKGLPVMAYVHGGGYTYGSGSEYNSAYFMDEDIVFVSFNYRLGVFGFLSTGDGVIPGNNGMKDMVVALKWVQGNIGKFGGNAEKVTIFGESAGGAAVHHLLLSPTTKGLIHGVISQSGSALNAFSNQLSPRENAVKLARYLDCHTNSTEPSDISSEEISHCLINVPADKLNKAQFKFRKSWPEKSRQFFFGPTVEPSAHVSNLTPFQSESPHSLLVRNDSKLPDIPWLVGATSDEGATLYAGIIMGDPELVREINSDWENITTSMDYNFYYPKEEQAQVATGLKKFYFDDKNVSSDTRAGLRNLYSDELILHAVMNAALEQAAKVDNTSVYLYQFAYKWPWSLLTAFGFNKGAEEKQLVGHADDLPVMFSYDQIMAASGVHILPDSPAEQVSKNIVKLWVSFAKNGRPDHRWGNASENEWKPVSKKEAVAEEPLKWFRISENPETVEVDESVMERMKFWSGVWNEHLVPVLNAKFKMGKL